MTEEDLRICRKAIRILRINNPKEIKFTQSDIPEYTFDNFWELVIRDNYRGTKEEALTWWRNQKNPML